MNEDLPKYLCHKTVRALKIAYIDKLPDDGGAWLSPENGDYIQRRMPAHWMKRHTPVAPGYLVYYEDGYISWSPADTFEKGYSLAL